MKLWVDDIREAPKNWAWAKTFTEAKTLIERCDIDEISLDHDLGGELTGYDILNYIEWRKMVLGVEIPKIIHVHTANPVGRQRMQIVVQKLLAD